MSRSSRSIIALLAPILLVTVACGGTTAPSTSAAPSTSVAPTASPTTAASPSASAAAGEWVVITPDGGGFQVEMPGAAVEQTQTANTAVGAIELHIATFSTATGAYFASWSDYPAGSITDPAASLLGARDGAVKNINGTLVEDAPIQREGLQGRSLTATVAGGTYQAEIFLQGDRMFQLGIASADGSTDFDADRFFSSFKLTS